MLKSQFLCLTIGPVAQLAEQQTLNLRVVGSIPTRLTNFHKQFSEFHSAARHVETLSETLTRQNRVEFCGRVRLKRGQHMTVGVQR